MPKKPQAEPKKRGAPSTFDADVAAEICRRLAAGEALAEICRTGGMPCESTVRGWAIDNAGGTFSAMYTRARDVGLDCQNDEALRIAKDGKTPVDRARLIVDTLKWRLAKMAPKRYGDRLELAGDPNAPLVLTVAETLRQRRAKRLGEGEATVLDKTIDE